MFTCFTSATTVTNTMINQDVLSLMIKRLQPQLVVDSFVQTRTVTIGYLMLEWEKEKPEKPKVNPGNESVVQNGGKLNVWFTTKSRHRLATAL